jgi:nitrite reductase/ring-hydroxylating ferredoxin subunit
MMNWTPYKRLAILLVVAGLLLGCSNDRANRNPFLPEIGFRYDINLNLPLYSPLTNPGNAVYIGAEGVGIRGAFVINTGFDYVAFEASCPNHAPNSCSTMELDGQTAICPCEDYQYSLFTGQQLNRPDDGNRYYDMLNYRASKSGNVVVISN